eukprot:6553704-Karenia_brevis.AAC.1
MRGGSVVAACGAIARWDVRGRLAVYRDQLQCSNFSLHERWAVARRGAIGETNGRILNSGEVAS